MMIVTFLVNQAPRIHRFYCSS